MYSLEQQDHTAAARTTGTATLDTTSYLQPCAGAAAAARSLQLPAHHPGHQALRTAPAVPPRRGKSAKKHAAAAAARHSPSPSSSRRSSTTVVATDVANFRAMVQELTGFPPAAIFRPLPRRVHAASPFVAVAAGQGCGHGGSEATNSSTAGAGSGSGSGSSPGDAPAVPPVALAAQQQPQFAPLGVFDGLPDLGSPEFDSWGDLSID
jgi:hypothetical protein